MKKIIFFLSLIFLVSNIFGQVSQESRKDPLTNVTESSLKDFQHYSKKQRNQKTTACILLGGVIALTAAWVGVQIANVSQDLLLPLLTGEQSKANFTGSYLPVACLASMATSISFFIA